MIVKTAQHTFEMECEPIEVTSISRPDERWAYTDPSGHMHRWEWEDDKREYRPGVSASVPTVRYVVDGVDVDECGDEHEYGHHECVLCGAHVTIGTTADTCRQYMPGLKTYRVDGAIVSEAEFKRIYNAQHGTNF